MIEELKWWKILLASGDVVIYGLCCLLIIKRKQYTYISIRSPTLLLITNFSNFLISVVLILKYLKIIESNFITIFFYIFKSVMMISLFLRYERLMSCFSMNNENIFDMRDYNDKRHLILEKVYIRISFFLFLAITIIIILLYFINIKYFELFDGNNKLKGNLIIWIIWHFLEQFILLTYISRIVKKEFKYYLTYEIFVLAIVSFLYSNFCFYIIAYNNNLDFNLFYYVSILFFFICLIINGYLPIFMSCCSKKNINFSFTIKLANNLYLFLADERCYQAFSEYLAKKGNNGSFYLKVYTHIMKYKLDIKLQKYNENGRFNEANRIFNNYFLTDKYIVIDIISKVKEKCQILKINESNENMFDDGLQYVFEELNNRFTDFRNTQKFKDLLYKINLDSFIECKLYNIGLINKK